MKLNAQSIYLRLLVLLACSFLISCKPTPHTNPLGNDNANYELVRVEWNPEPQDLDAQISSGSTRTYTLMVTYNLITTGGTVNPILVAYDEDGLLNPDPLVVLPLNYDASNWLPGIYHQNEQVTLKCENGLIKGVNVSAADGESDEDVAEVYLEVSRPGGSGTTVSNREVKIRCSS